MVIAEEFGEWEDSKRRIDLLGLDREANLVVIELKRTVLTLGSGVYDFCRGLAQVFTISGGTVDLGGGTCAGEVHHLHGAACLPGRAAVLEGAYAPQPGTMLTMLLYDGSRTGTFGSVAPVPWTADYSQNGSVTLNN